MLKLIQKVTHATYPRNGKTTVLQKGLSSHRDIDSNILNSIFPVHDLDKKGEEKCFQIPVADIA